MRTDHVGSRTTRPAGSNGSAALRSRESRPGRRTVGDNFRAASFRADCLKSETDVPAPGTFTLNGIGTILYNITSEPMCRNCGSEKKTLFFCVFWIPFVPLGRYRVLHVRPGMVSAGPYIGWKPARRSS